MDHAGDDQRRGDGGVAGGHTLRPQGVLQAQLIQACNARRSQPTERTRECSRESRCTAKPDPRLSSVRWLTCEPERTDSTSRNEV